MPLFAKQVPGPGNAMTAWGEHDKIWLTMSTTLKMSGALRRVVRLNETAPDEAAELLLALASAPAAPQAAALDYLLDDDVEPASGD